MSSNLAICTLGTASQAPTVKRALNSTVIRSEKGSYIIDCGEGTQSQLGASPIKHSSVSKILITHLHGDHCFGLPGLLCLVACSYVEIKLPDDVALNAKTAKKQKTEPVVIDIYGPYGLARYLRTSLQVSRTFLACKFRVHELMPSKLQIENTFPTFETWNPPTGAEDIPLHFNELPSTVIHSETSIIDDQEWVTWKVFEDNAFTCIATELIHKVPCFGFVFQEPERKGLLDKDKLRSFGLYKSPLCGKLNKGIPVEKDGKIIQPEDVLKPVTPGRKVAVLGDCSCSLASVGPCMNADVVLHESTLENQFEELAIDHGHSTPRMAVNFADKCRARKLILNHFSQRYKKHTDVAIESDKKEEEIVQATDKILLTEGRECANALGLTHVKEEFVDIAEDLKIFYVGYA